jgi:hypothetical protein
VSRALIVSAWVATACGPNVGNESAETAANTSSGNADSTTESGVADGWPALWFGGYYWVGENITLGVPSKSEPYFDTFYNVTLGFDAVTVEHFNATGERAGTFSSTPRFEAGLAILHPEPGDTHLDIPPFQEGKARAELSASDDASCETMTMRIIYRDDTSGPGFTDFTLRRGRICLLEPLQELPDYMQDTLLIDICPEEPTPSCTTN